MIGVRCPKCGLMQMPRPACKSCGAPLGGAEWRPSPPPAQVSRPVTPSRASIESKLTQPEVASKKGFSKAEAIRFGWNTMMSNPGFFVVLLIVVGLIYVLPEIIRKSMEGNNPALTVPLGLVSAVLQIIIGMGLIRISLRFCDNQKGEFADLFSCLPLFFKYLFGSILYGLIVLAGIILLIIPGIVWAIKFMFFSYLIIDQGAGPIDSLKRSAAITAGAKWDLFLFGLLLLAVNLLGTLALLIGLFATIPTSMVATAYVYRKLLGKA